MDYYIEGIRKYADFKGRSTRKEYWMFALFNGIICLLVMLADILVLGYSPENIALGYGTTVPILSLLYGFALTIPCLAIAWRRMHDIGKSGAWYFITLVPVIGGIWYLILLCQPSIGGGIQKPLDGISY